MNRSSPHARHDLRSVVDRAGTATVEKAWEHAARARAAVLRRRAAYVVKVARFAGAVIADNAVIPPGSKMTGRTSIGERTEFSGPVFIEGPGEVTIGRWAAIGHGFRVITTSHNTSHANMHMPLQLELGLPTFYEARGPVSVGHATWIGDGVTVLGGVTIGEGAVVGAGALITTDIPPFAIVAGNPARKIRSRFDDEVIAALLTVAWWNWPVDKILHNPRFFECDLTAVSGPEVLELVVT